MSKFLRLLSLCLGIATKLRSLLRAVAIGSALLCGASIHHSHATDLKRYSIDGANPAGEDFLDATITVQKGSVGPGNYYIKMTSGVEPGSPSPGVFQAWRIGVVDSNGNFSLRDTNFSPVPNPATPDFTRNAANGYEIKYTIHTGSFNGPQVAGATLETVAWVLPYVIRPGTSAMVPIARAWTITMSGPPPATRTIDISVGVRNWEAVEYKLAIAARGPSGNAIPTQIGVVQAAVTAKQTVDGKEKTVTTPGEALIQGTLQEPTPDAWKDGVHYGYVLRPDGTVLTDGAGPITIATATKYNDGLHMFSDIGVPPPPLPDDIIEKPDAPEPPPKETPGSPTTPKPGTEPPTDPRGTPTPVPTQPTVPTMDPNIEPWTRPMTGVGGSGTGGAMTPADFYNGIRAALGDDAAAGDGAGEGNGNGGIGGVGGGNELGDITGSLEKRGDLDKVQGELNETIARAQNTKAKLAEKITPYTKTDWIKPSGLGKDLKIEMGTATIVGGKSLDIAIDLNKFSGPVAAIRLGLQFCLAVALFIYTLNDVRDGIA